MRELINFLASAIDRLIPLGAGIYLVFLAKKKKKEMDEPYNIKKGFFSPKVISIIGWFLTIISSLLIIGKFVMFYG